MNKNCDMAHKVMRTDGEDTYSEQYTHVHANRGVVHLSRGDTTVLAVGISIEVSYAAC